MTPEQLEQVDQAAAQAASEPLREEITELLSEAVETLRKARALAASSDLYATRHFGWDIQNVIPDVQGLLDAMRDSGGGDQ